MVSVAVGVRPAGLRSPVLSASAAVLMNAKTTARRIRMDIQWRMAGESSADVTIR
jgi:hypothetical protein